MTTTTNLGMTLLEVGQKEKEVTINTNMGLIDALVGYKTAVATITVGASPFVYHNTNPYSVDVLTSGGTVSSIQFSRDGSNYYTYPSGEIVNLSPGDYVKVTYTALPTMVSIPR